MIERSRELKRLWIFAFTWMLTICMLVVHWHFAISLMHASCGMVAVHIWRNRALILIVCGEVSGLCIICCRCGIQNLYGHRGAMRKKYVTLGQRCCASHGLNLVQKERTGCMPGLMSGLIRSSDRLLRVSITSGRIRYDIPSVHRWDMTGTGRSDGRSRRGIYTRIVYAPCTTIVIVCRSSRSGSGVSPAL